MTTKITSILEIAADGQDMLTDTMLGPSRALQQARQGGVGLLDPQLSVSPSIELELKLELGRS